MMRIVSLLLVFILLGCGSRKVDKSESVQVLEQSRINDVRNDMELSVRDSFINRYVSKNSVFRADEIKIDADGGIVISNPVIKTVEESKDSLSVGSSELRDAGVSRSSDVLNDVRTDLSKNVQREQYSWWGMLVPLGVLLVVVYLVRRFFLKN